jgi:hypothetical protein
MGFFDNILEKLGIKKEKKEEVKPGFATPASSTGSGKPIAATAGAGMREAAGKANSSVEFAPKAISEVDVVAKLEALSKGKGLNWKVSIVELLTLLEIDSSKDARIELAKELDCPPDFIGGDYSKMNVWLHKEVLRKIAANGGNIPKELLD